MEYSFKLNNNWYGSKEDCGFKTSLYHRINVTLKPGITVLVGCNGAGKTTFLKQLKRKLEKEKTPFLLYDNLKDGGSNAINKAGFFEDFSFIATAIQSSEGENINMNVGNFAREVGNYVYKKLKPTDKVMFLLVDAVDSGMSIDHIYDLKENFFRFVSEDLKKSGVDLYVVVSANSYEMAREENCLDVYNAKYVKFNDYEEYRKFILHSRGIKDKRYGHLTKLEEHNDKR